MDSDDYFVCEELWKSKHAPIEWRAAMEKDDYHKGWGMRREHVDRTKQRKKQEAARELARQKEKDDKAAAESRSKEQQASRGLRSTGLRSTGLAIPSAPNQEPLIKQDKPSIAPEEGIKSKGPLSQGTAKQALLSQTSRRGRKDQKPDKSVTPLSVSKDSKEQQKSKRKATPEFPPPKERTQPVQLPTPNVSPASQQFRETTESPGAVCEPQHGQHHERRDAQSPLQQPNEAFGIQKARLNDPVESSKPLAHQDSATLKSTPKNSNEGEATARSNGEAVLDDEKAASAGTETAASMLRIKDSRWATETVEVETAADSTSDATTNLQDPSVVGDGTIDQSDPASKTGVRSPESQQRQTSKMQLSIRTQSPKQDARCSTAQTRPAKAAAQHEAGLQLRSGRDGERQQKASLTSPSTPQSANTLKRLVDALREELRDQKAHAQDPTLQSNISRGEYDQLRYRCDQGMARFDDMAQQVRALHVGFAQLQREYDECRRTMEKNSKRADSSAKTKQNEQELRAQLAEKERELIQYKVQITKESDDRLRYDLGDEEMVAPMKHVYGDLLGFANKLLRGGQTLRE